MVLHRPVELARIIGTPTEICIDTVIVALVDYFCSEVRLASAWLPQKSQNLIFLSGDLHVHQSLQGPFLFVFIHLCRRPRAHLVSCSACLPQAGEGPAFRSRSGGLQTGSAMAASALVSSRAQPRDSLFAGCVQTLH